MSWFKDILSGVKAKPTESSVIFPDPINKRRRVESPEEILESELQFYRECYPDEISICDWIASPKIHNNGWRLISLKDVFIDTTVVPQCRVYRNAITRLWDCETKKDNEVWIGYAPFSLAPYLVFSYGQCDALLKLNNTYDSIPVVISHEFSADPTIKKQFS